MGAPSHKRACTWGWRNAWAMRGATPCTAKRMHAQEGRQGGWDTAHTHTHTHTVRVHATYNTVPAPVAMGDFGSKNTGSSFSMPATILSAVTLQLENHRSFSGMRGFFSCVPGFWGLLTGRG